MPVQCPGGLADFVTNTAGVTSRVGQMLGLNVVENSQLAVVGELVADAAHVLALHVAQVTGQGVGQVSCNIGSYRTQVTLERITWAFQVG